MKKRISCLIICLYLSLLLPAYGGEESYFDQGKKYLDQGKKQEALECFAKTVQAQPKNFYAYYYQGLIHLQLKEYLTALEAFNRALALNSHYASPYIGRGVLYYQQKDYQKALEDLNTAVKLIPNNANAYNKRALVYAALGQKDKAKADFAKANNLLNQKIAKQNSGKVILIENCPEKITVSVFYSLAKKESKKQALQRALEQGKLQALDKVASSYHPDGLSNQQTRSLAKPLLKLDKIHEEKIVSGVLKLKVTFSLDTYEMQKRIVEFQINKDNFAVEKQDGWTIYRQQF